MTNSRSSAADSSASATNEIAREALPTDSASIRTGLEAGAIAAALVDTLHYVLGKLPQHATSHDWYRALAHAVRDRMADRCISTLAAIAGSRQPKQGRRLRIRDLRPDDRRRLAPARRC